MGYWPSKLIAVLNIILMVGYAVISCIIGGQILSAVSGGSTSVVVGIVIIALITWAIAVFGMTLFHAYERYDLNKPGSHSHSQVETQKISLLLFEVLEALRTLLTSQQMGMDTPNPRPLYPHRVRRAPLQHLPILRR